MATVGDLKLKLAGLPDQMEVYIHHPEDEFPCRPIDEMELQEVQHREDPSGPVLAREKALVLKMG